jgi:hypothetical protein
LVTDGDVAVGGLENLVHALGAEGVAEDARDCLAGGDVGPVRVEGPPGRDLASCSLRMMNGRPNSSKSSAMAAADDDACYARAALFSEGSGRADRARRRR